MKCQEVMIYMQRQLDGDLAPKEENELHAHLMHCLDCAQMFERLQALSNELSQLPKVMPPFSLVDAIMPQLLELDKQNEMSNADNVVVFPTKVAKIESEEDMPKHTRVSRFKEQFSWKFASGVVAAGLIIGFFAFNMQNPVIDNADGIMSRSSSDSKSGVAENRVTATSDLNQKVAKEDIALNKENAMSNEGSPIAPTTDLFAKGTEPADTSTGTGGNSPQATPKAQLEKPGAYSSPANGSDMETRQVAPSTSPPERLRDPDTVVPKPNKVDSSAEATTPVASLNVPQSTFEPKPTESPVKKMAPVPSIDPSTSDRISASQGIFSLTIPQNEAKLKSTTGIYEAAIEDAHVVIRNTLTLEIVFASKLTWQAEDQIKLLEWSKDDKLFYEVISKGSLQTILIDVKEKTETNK
ncbi:hypothetical protein ASG89_08530 [Paenibacillus sp. Soil766]|uniref:anti-sigma factor family protein n=1 Tax=Paenibacillus sp. Soil766 TaxID=1736404 RepID=UPI00070FF86F|nr:zf-HC2 domain-containing protein [Paenibacillus sp. Soil766]KRE90338.1 hypothetical protein ASG89_08530 [Paenibacillus sp. Soil766]